MLAGRSPQSQALTANAAQVQLVSRLNPLPAFDDAYILCHTLSTHLVECDVLNLLVESQAQLRHVTQQALHHDATNNIIAQHSTCTGRRHNTPHSTAAQHKQGVSGSATRTTVCCPWMLAGQAQAVQGRMIQPPSPM